MHFCLQFILIFLEMYLCGTPASYHMQDLNALCGDQLNRNKSNRKLYHATETMNFDKDKKNLLFVINPISHGIKGIDIEKIINRAIDHSIYHYSIVYTSYPGHATELASKAAAEDIDIVVAVGGDGTVNEVGAGLLYSDTALAILPVGSGNGLARHLGISMKMSEALKQLNRGNIYAIDTGIINDKLFLGTAGLGFDAQISWDFATFRRRGLYSYIRVALLGFSKYKPKTYQIIIDDKQAISRDAFIITFANSSQYGNNCVVAPQANIADGYMDLVIVKDLPAYSIPEFIYDLKFGKLQPSKRVQMVRFREIIVKQSESQTEIQAHVDGEPILFRDEVRVKVQPFSLKVVGGTAGSL